MLLEAKDIKFSYSKEHQILDSVSLAVERGEKVGLIGASGSGKSTLAQIMAGYLKPDSGQVLINGIVVPKKNYSPVQLIYQHPEQALNPRLKLSASVKEALGLGIGQEKFELQLNEIGIEKSWLNRYPHQLSGGELQRFCILRALNPQTKFIIADEITTMLDVITQAQIWDILCRAVKQRDMGLLVITHNRYLADKICDRLIFIEDINKKYQVV